MPDTIIRAIPCAGFSRHWIWAFRDEIPQNAGPCKQSVARADPEWINKVITLGSPFGKGRHSASHGNRLYQHLNAQPDERDNEEFSHPATSPHYGVYTRGDGVVNWRASLQPGDNHQVHSIEMLGSHIGLNLNAVWYWVAKKLAER